MTETLFKQCWEFIEDKLSMGNENYVISLDVIRGNFEFLLFDFDGNYQEDSLIYCSGSNLMNTAEKFFNKVFNRLL